MSWSSIWSSPWSWSSSGSRTAPSWQSSARRPSKPSTRHRFLALPLYQDQLPWCCQERCCVLEQVSRNLLVTLIESVRVRCILLWHAQKWSLERAAGHSAYFAHIAEAERRVARHRAEEGGFVEQDGEAVLRRSARLNRGTSASSLSSSIGR